MTPLPDPAPILELIEAFRRSKTMFAAVELGVFDALAAGPATAESLAESLGAATDSLARLLNACVGLGLLQRDGQRYANTPQATAYLTSTSDARMTGYIRYSNSAMWRLWAHLEDAVRENSHRWQQAFGWDGPIFSHFFRTEAAKRDFLMGMHGFGVLTSPHVIEAFDLSGFRRLADLGGATGHLVIAACQRHSALRGVVFDLPDALPLAREIVAASGLSDRIDIVAGDFFVDQLPDADLYALGRIVHDWNVEKIGQLFGESSRPCRRAALLIAEKILDEDGGGPRWAQMQDLNMLTCTEGRERTLSQYRELLERAGFVEIEGRRTAAPLDAILARKPGR